MSDITPAELQKMKTDLASMEQELVKFQRLFEADGFVDTVEQEDLKRMQASISLIGNRVTAENNIAAHGFTPINWDDLFHEYRQSMQIYINNVKGACRDIKGFITQENESAGGNIVFAIFSTVIGTFGPQYAIGIKIVEEALKILQSKPQGTLTQFHTSWIDSLDAVKADRYLKITYADFESYLKTTVAAGRSIDKVSHGEAVNSIQTFIDDKHLSSTQMKQAYTQAWIDSAENGWGIPGAGGAWNMNFEEADLDAGYIYVKANYIFPMVNGITRLANPNIDFYTDGIWRDHELHIDDMPKAKGTNQALIAAFGATTPLEQLPMKMVAYVQTQVQNGSFKPLQYHGPQKYTKAKGGNWSIEMGDDKILSVFQKYISKKMVKDLGVE
ncbi:MAG: hypothetical protein AB8E82_08120 [Aureispira sp.]